MVRALDVVPLPLRQPVAHPEGGGELRVGLGEADGSAEREQRVRELHVGHHERAVLPDGVAKILNRRRVVALHVVGAEPRRVAAEGVQRGRGHLVEARRLTHGLERLAHPAAQRLRQAVHRRDEIAGVLRRLAVRCELVSGFGGDESRRDDVAIARAHHAPADHRLGAGTLRDLPGGDQVHARRVGTPHLLERRDDGARRHHSHDLALRQVRPHGLGDGRAERGVRARRVERGNQHLVARRELAGREQRALRSDAEHAQDHESGDEQCEHAHGEDPAAGRTLPRDVRARLHRDRRHRSLHGERRRAARRVRGRRGGGTMRHVLRVRRKENDRQPERHDDERAEEHPLRKSDRDDRRARHDRDADERADVDGKGAQHHGAAADEDRRHRRRRGRRRRHRVETSEQLRPGRRP